MYKERIPPRQREALVLAAQGLTNEEIARRMSVARGTIYGYFYHIYDRLNIHPRRRSEAVRRFLVGV